MKSLIFSVTIKILKPIFWIIAIWLLVRGHNAPGGGFVAGLVAATAVILQILNGGWSSLHPRLRENLFEICGIGIFISIFSGAMALLIGNPFMTGRWMNIRGLEIGSPVIFDAGVFILVFAVVLICAGYLLKDEDEEAL
jgi:multisubunit Na+/H+ antiporter MnhB subunit